MAFYITLFILTTIGSFFEFFSLSEFHKKIIFYALILLFIFISAIRYTNPDWDVYYPLFVNHNDFTDFTTDNQVDYGYAVVNFLIKCISDDFSVLLGTLAVVIIGIVALFIRRFSPYPLISLLYWFGTYKGEIFFNRQSLAIALTLVAFRFIVTRRPIPFVLLTLLAASMQVSTIVFLLAYPIYHLRLQPLHLVMALCSAAVVGTLFDPSLLLSIGVLLNVISIDQERLATKIALYYDTGTSDGEHMVWGMLRRVLFIPLELWAVKKMSLLNAYYRGMINLIVFGYSLYFLLRNVSPTIATRISSPFYYYEIIAIPALFMLCRSVYTRMALFAVVAVYSLVKYYYALMLYESTFIPFVNIITGAY